MFIDNTYIDLIHNYDVFIDFLIDNGIDDKLIDYVMDVYGINNNTYENLMDYYGIDMDDLKQYLIDQGLVDDSDDSDDE